MEILIIILLMPLIGLLIGKNKGRGCEGFFFGLLLGPIGWVITALLGDESPKCPECLGVVNKKAKRCKNCGADLTNNIEGE